MAGLLGDDEYDRRLLARMQRDVGRTTNPTVPEQRAAIGGALRQGADLAADFLIPQTPADFALMAALGPGGRMARTPAAAGLLALESSDAEASRLRRAAGAVRRAARSAGDATGDAGDAATAAPARRRGTLGVQPAASQSEEEVARSFGMTVEELRQVRAANMAQVNQFNNPANRIAAEAQALGFAARMEEPGDTTSRYVRVGIPGARDEVVIRIADHEQPTEYVPDPRGAGGLVRMPVGGYSKELRARHPAADFSVDPRTRYTEADALEFLRGLAARGLAPVGVGVGGLLGSGSPEGY